MACSLSLREEELLSNKVREFPVLYDKNVKGYNEIPVVKHVWDAVAEQLEFVEDGEKAQVLFTTLKKKYLRKKREWKEAKKLKVSHEVKERTERGFHTYLFLSWLDQYVQIRSLRKKYAPEDCVSDDESVKTEPQYTNNTASDIQVLTPEYTESILSTSKKVSLSCYPEPNHQSSSSPQYFASSPPLANPSNYKEHFSTHLSRKRRSSFSEENGLYEFEHSPNNAPYVEEYWRKSERMKIEKNVLDSEDLFCKAIAADLKDLPYFEKCMAKSEIRSIISKYQIEAYRKSDHGNTTNDIRMHVIDDSNHNSVALKKEQIATHSLENAQRPTMIPMTSYANNPASIGK